MNPLVVSASSWLPAGGWERLAVDALWQSTALAGAGLLLASLAPRRAALRAAILLAAVILSVAVPVLSSVVRAGGGGLLSRPEPVLAAMEKAELPPAAAPLAAVDWVASASTVEHIPAAPRSLWPWLELIWLAASGQLAWRLAWGWLGLRRAIRSAEPCRDPAICGELSRAAETLAVRVPPVLCSPMFETPALAGWLRPRLLVPPAMPPGVDWFAVFCHELGHLARRDSASRLAVEVCLVLLPWQPLVWIVRRQFRSACEEACDDWAVASGADPVELASLLVDLVPQPQPALSLGMAESPAATRRRVVRLLAMKGAVHPRLGLALGISGWMLAVGLGGALAMLQSGRVVEVVGHESAPASRGGPGYVAWTSPASDDPEPKAVSGVFYNYGDDSAKAASAPASPPWGSEPLDEAIATASAALPKTSGPPPSYIIEPPDVLLIDAVKLVPKAPYHIEPLDMLQVQVANPLIDQPIAGSYSVDPSGLIDLGAAYGRVKVAGKTAEEAEEAVADHLKSILREPQVSVSLAQTSGQQQIAGEHLVGPDGTVNLGTYGEVYVAGYSVAVAKNSIEQQLSKYLEQPRVSVDVFSYKSKVYYLIVQLGASGESVHRCPTTGNDTVLDSLAQATGKLPKLSDCWIWVARPGGQVLPVDWQKVIEGTDTTSNWRITAGDRIFIRRKTSGSPAAIQSQSEPQRDVEPAPALSASNEREAHFQLRNGRINYVPFDEFTHQVRSVFEQQAHKLRDNREVTETFGLGQYTVRYTISRVEIPEQEAIKTGQAGSYIQLSEFHFYPLSADVGEPVADAVNRGSMFRKALDGFDPNRYTIVVWTYPDSAKDFDRVRSELDQLGYRVASRPIPEGRAIGGRGPGPPPPAQAGLGSMPESPATGSAPVRQTAVAKPATRKTPAKPSRLATQQPRAATQPVRNRAQLPPPRTQTEVTPSQGPMPPLTADEIIELFPEATDEIDSANGEMAVHPPEDSDEIVPSLPEHTDPADSDDPPPKP